MKITVYSNNRLRETCARWGVARDFADPMLNYLVYGYEPGSCFTAVLANDFYRAMGSSHPSNTVEAFKALAGWIQDIMPREAFGNYEAVKQWTRLEEADRRAILERQGLIYTEQEEIMKTLRDERSEESVLY
jgi:hypothetical protein